MKNSILNKLILSVIMLFGIIACQERDIVKVENSSAPIVLNLSAEKLFLDSHFPDNPALNVTWDVAKYTVPVEINYKIEASATEDFAKPFTIGTVGQSVRTVTYTVSQMNAAAEAIGLKTGVASTMFIRVSSYLGANSVSASSNVTKISITPYELVYPDFYLVGAASSIGWNSGSALKLTKTKEIASITTTLKGGEPFRFLGQQNWNPLNYSIDQDGTRGEYRFFKQVSSNIIQDGDENMKFTGTTGTYKITINAKEKSLKIEAQ